MMKRLPIGPNLTTDSARIVDRDAADDALELAGFSVALALDDFAGEDDVFEIEDREVVIVIILRWHE